jgi:two-component system, LytTR family, response regulator
VNPMRVLIVDDEPLAREALQRVLRERPDVDSFEAVGDAVDALARLDAAPYDVLLLDIHMPEVSGLQMADMLKERKGPAPAIVFVTAFDEHAVAAFEKQAVDYVLKPFAADRVNKALDNARLRSAQERAAVLAEMLPRLETLARPARIAIKSKGRIVFLSASEILAAEAEGNYVLLQQRTGTHLLREPISMLAEKLRPYGFLRIHRSVLVNSAHVETIEPLFTGEYLLRMKGGKEYNVTRTYKKNLAALASFWIGPDTFPGV